MSPAGNEGQGPLYGAFTLPEWERQAGGCARPQALRGGPAAHPLRVLLWAQREWEPDSEAAPLPSNLVNDTVWSTEKPEAGGTGSLLIFLPAVSDGSTLTVLFFIMNQECM